MPLLEIAVGDDRSLQDVADLIFQSHKILVITGAGISTSCGIPDFRSKDGLYNLIPEQSSLLTPPPSAPSTPSRKRKAYTTDDEDIPTSSQSSISSTSSRRSSGAMSKLRGQDLFDSSVWKNPVTTATFYQFIASLRQKIHEEVKDTSPTHKFMRTLTDSGRLMRCYTQNIDGLETRDGLCMDLSRGPGNRRRFMKKHFEAPLPEQTLNTDFDGGCEIVPLHGDLERLRCTLCQDTCEWSAEATEEFLDGRAPECEKCSSKSDQRQANGKRGLAVGSLRPNIVLYGEEHPSNTLLAPFVPFDIASGPEVLIIMGTSLKVFGLQKVVRDFAKAVHSAKKGKGRVIFINRTRPAESVWDGIIDDYIAMDCDDWVRDVNTRRPDLSLRQSAIDRKVTKPDVTRKRKSVEAGQEEKPTKEAKLVVEIPKLPKKAKMKTKPPTVQVVMKDPQRHVGPALLHTASTLAAVTPQVVSRSWKQSKTNHPNRHILSPMVQLLRPKPSPLFKTLVQSEMDGGPQSVERLPRSPLGPKKNPGSPQRPPFSPFTPSSANIASPKRSQVSPLIPHTPNTPKRRMDNIFKEVTGEGSAEQDETLAEGEIELAENEREKENRLNDAEDGGESESENGRIAVNSKLNADTPSRESSYTNHGPASLVNEDETVELRKRMKLGRLTGTSLYMRMFGSSWL